MLCLCRVTEVTNLIETLETKLTEIDNSLLVFKDHLRVEGVQYKACSQLVKQIQSSLSKAGHVYNDAAAEEEVVAATTEGALVPLLKIYYSQLKKLEVFAAAKELSNDAIRGTTASRRATSAKLATLQAYLRELSAGKDNALMHPMTLKKWVHVARSFSSPLSSYAAFVAMASFRDIILGVCSHV